ncbi:uncharacterized protein PV06_11246 [Exophiala oligosperma]|uniref:Uncharacterized protein n=1 Tax=Exophiala oligosperma TaxID=215243 RepID=A0A0D2BGG2_9EURO|nr:uncharacterized protein PV06_11246 [Exophiala oligosperma]KIW36537.1 hypothetical protein PV06_11246 [Exophiala oligosperma]
MGKSTASGKQHDDQLKMMQCSLILGVLSTLQGFHYEFDVTRLLEDLVQREKETWVPRVDTEDHDKFQDAQTDHSISWEGLTSEFVSAFPGVLPKDAEAQKTLACQLRSQLRHNLEQMSQLPDWPQKSFLKPLRQFVWADLTWEMNVWLVLRGSAVIPSGNLTGLKPWSRHNRDLRQLAEILGTSCLFSKPVTDKKLTVTSLQDCIQKLEILFCGSEINHVNSGEATYVVAFYLCKANDDAFIRHFRSLPCLSTIGRDPSSEPGKWQYRCVLEKHESSVTQDDLFISNRRPTYCKAFESQSQALQCWEDIVGRSEQLLHHRCPRPFPGSRSTSDRPEVLEAVELVRAYMP